MAMSWLVILAVVLVAPFALAAARSFVDTVAPAAGTQSR
jgi:hypothetical protein